MSEPELTDEEINDMSILIVPDGEGNWCAVRGNHVNLHESPSGHGLTPGFALQALHEDEMQIENEKN